MQNIYLSVLAVLTFATLLMYACTAGIQVETGPKQSPSPAAGTNSSNWEAEWSKTIENAKKEGIVVWYGATGAAQSRDPFIRAMKENFGISLDATIAGGAQLTAKLTNERRAGLYLADVYIGGSTSIVNELLPAKMLEPIEPYFILPEVKDPKMWFGGSLPIWDSQKTTLGALAIVNSRLAINTKLVQPQELTSYKDLLNPKLKGLIVLSDPTISGSGLSWFSSSANLMGMDYMKELVKQELMITRDFRLLNDWLARGKYAVGLGVNPGGVAALKQDGAPISMLPPFKEGVDLGFAGGMIAVVNRSPHPNATKVFVNWVLSKEGQTIHSRAQGIASRRLDVPTDHLDSWQIPNLSFNYIIESEQDVIDEYKKIELAREIFSPILK